MIDITDDNFEEEVMKSELPVMVECWAQHCGACIAILPLVEKIEEEYEGKMKVVKMNLDFASKTARSLGVTGLPTFLFVRDGRVIDRFSGTRSIHVIEKCLAKLLE